MILGDKVTVTILTEAGGISRLDGTIVGITHIVPPRYDVRVTKTGEIKANMAATLVALRSEKSNVVAIGGR